MNSKRLLSLIVLTMVLIAALTACTSCFACNGNGPTGGGGSSGGGSSGGGSSVVSEQVTITFDTNGGSAIDPVTIEKGKKLENVPQAYLAGNSFDGWYTDEELTEEFRVDTEINKNMTLYAGYSLVDVEVNVTKPVSRYAEDVEQNHSVTIIATTAYTAAEFLKAIKIEGISTLMPWEMPEELDESLPTTIDGWFEVTVSGNKYTLSPKKLRFNGQDVYAYISGKYYKITIPSSMQFEDFEDSVIEYSFRIETEIKDATDNVEYLNKDALIFVKKEEIKNLDDITEIKTEESSSSLETEITTFCKDANGYYNFLFSETTYKKYNFQKEDIVCIGNGEELAVGSIFVKVMEIYGQSNGDVNTEETVTDGEYLVLAVDAEVEEVFSYIDVNYNSAISVDDIIASLDTTEMTETLKTNGSLEKVTGIMTGLLMVSDEVQDVYKADYQAKNLGSVDHNTGLPDFCSNAYIKNEQKLLSFDLLKGAEVSISVGPGYNPNFDAAYTDNFAALRIVFSYETTIKDRLQIDAEIEFTQYLAASAQGYLEYKMGFFKLKWAEFDAAVNLYSQTDFNFKILVRTVKPDDVDHNNGNNTGNNNNNEEDENPFVDIADKISEKLQSEDGDDPNNLVAELQEMLKSEEGYLELFRAPILRIPIDIIPGIPVMRLTVKLDFVIEMNFAAGFSAHMSVLEAVQVGVKGDTRTKTISSYKHDNLIGGNQYAVQLSACGYLGIRAGLKGGLSVSFCGLSSLGDVGVYVYVGPYIDIYGFAQATFAKQDGKVTQSLVGGYYIEIGIFLEVTLEARSDMFGVKVGVTLFDKKWPLISFGNKEVLISIAQGGLDETIYVENKGESTASMSVDLLPKLQGTYLDITTGETKVKDVPWDKVSLRMSASNFSYDAENKTINYSSKGGTIQKGSETCIATYHYNGSILQFNASADKYKEFYPFAQATIIYYDSSKIDKENAGKMVKVKFYSLVDGKKELMQEQEVMVGDTIFGYATLDPCKYTNITWDKVPHDTMITEETEFVCTGDPIQVYTAFIYYDVEKDVWVTDIRACNLGDVPIAPAIPDKEDKLTFTGWLGQDGVNVKNRVRITPSDYVGATLTAAHLKQYGFFIDTTTGKDPNTSVAYYSPDTNNDWSRYDELTEADHKSESGWTWYYAVVSIYVANYASDNCTITIYNSDASGKQIIDTETVSYRGYPTRYYTYSPLEMEFIGFALEKDGEVVYKDIRDLGCVKHDVVLYAKYQRIVHTIKLYKYDVSTDSYSLYKTTSLNGGQRVSELGDDLAAIKTANGTTAEGILECKFAYLQDRENEESDDYAYVSDTNVCVKPLNIYPIFGKKLKVVFDAGDGKIIGGEGPVSQIEYFSESKLNYKIKDFPIACVKESADPTYRYEHVGWKNQLTGEEIYFKDFAGSEWGEYAFEAVCNKPTTLKAIYEEIERTDYSVYITTPYGTLKDGRSTVIDLKDLTYNEYNEYKTEYEGWYPNQYRDDANHCTWTSNGVTDKSTSNTYHLEYIFTKAVDKFNVDVDYNGGRQDEGCATSKYINIEWGTEIDLSQQKVVREEDEYGTWRAVNWTDEAGNEYALDAVYTVSGNDTLKLNWEIVTHKEYKIYFTVKDENDKVIFSTKKTYHKDDSLASIGNPEIADGKVFSGWTWKHWNYVEIENAPLDKMPAEDIRLEGRVSEVEIIYVLDGREIDRTTGRVAYEETVKDNYLKEGYTVTPWTTIDVTVSNGKFVMPEKDVTFTATSTINSYKLTYYHNDEVYVAEQTVEYGKLVRLPRLPIEEGIEYIWVSGDVKIYDIGFYMPANDVIIQTSVFESVKYVIYYVNDEIVSYRQATAGQQFGLPDLSQDEKYAGMTFSGWYTTNATISANSMLTVGQENVYVYGYFTEGTTKVNVYFDDTNSSPDLVLYANDGDTLTLAAKISDKEIFGYKVNGVETTQITVSGTSDINAYVQYVAKKYEVAFEGCGHGFTLPQSEYYAAGTKVVLPALPTEDTLECEGWFTVETEILTDTDGSLYFIMPARNVMVSVKVKYYDYDQSSKTAKVYINSPYSNEPVLYKDYTVYSEYNHIAPVYFDAPAIEGYEFVCWKDENGETITENQGVCYEDMGKDVCSYYGEYRKIELHIIEFRINNEIVAYREFYDFCEVTVDAPVIELKEGEDFSGWFNDFLRPWVTDEGTIRFYVGDRETHQYSGMDFVFNGYIYNTENAYEVVLNENDSNDLYTFYVNLGGQIKLNRMLNGYEVSYQLEVSYGSGFTTNFIDYDFVTQTSEEYVINIPTLEQLKTILKISDETEITCFRIIARATGDNADSINC